MNPLTNILTPKIRQTLYVIYALAGVAIGAAHVAYAEGAWTLPVWLKVTESVVLFLGGAFGLTAASNITRPDPQDVEDYQPRHAEGDAL